MFNKASRELERNYGYYFGLFVLQIIIMAVVQYVMYKIVPDRPDFSDMVSISPNQVTVHVPSDLNMLLNQTSPLARVLSLVSLFITTLLAVLVLRSILQKIKNSGITIGESALFRTHPGHAFLLPFKVLGANILTILFAGIIMWAGIFLFFNSVRTGETPFAMAIIMFLVMLAMGVIVSPISYLIAYDEEGRYNFWSSFTKGISIGIKHFWRILKTSIVVILLFVLFTVITAAVIGFFANHRNGLMMGIVGDIAFLTFVFG